jgi:hypothetical protein
MCAGLDNFCPYPIENTGNGGRAEDRTRNTKRNTNVKRPPGVSAIPGGFLGGSARRSAFTGSIRYSRSRAFWQCLSVNISSSRISSRASTLFFMDVSRNRNPHFLFEKGHGILSMSADLSRRQAKMPQYLLKKYSIYSIINYQSRRF